MLNRNHVKVGAWVAIREGAAISYRVNGRTDAEFHCGEETSGFDLVFDPEPLREFVRAATQALEDLDAR
jgi:hypothetical protein